MKLKVIKADSYRERLKVKSAGEFKNVRLLIKGFISSKGAICNSPG